MEYIFRFQELESEHWGPLFCLLHQIFHLLTTPGLEHLFYHIQFKNSNSEIAKQNSSHIFANGLIAHLFYISAFPWLNFSTKLFAPGLNFSPNESHLSLLQ